MKLLRAVVCWLALGSANAAFSASVLDGIRTYDAVKYALTLEIFLECHRVVQAVVRRQRWLRPWLARCIDD